MSIEIMDMAIVAEYEARSEEAITHTKEKYGGYLNSIAYNILRIKEDTEECVADSYMKIWNAIPPAKPLSLKAFAGRITRNTALDYLEKGCAQKRGGGEAALALEELSECISAKSDSPEGSLEGKELGKAINELLKILPKQQRQVFVLRYYYLYSTDEIAERMKMTKGNVSTSLSRSRKALLEKLTEEGWL